MNTEKKNKRCVTLSRALISWDTTVAVHFGLLWWPLQQGFGVGSSCYTVRKRTDNTYKIKCVLTRFVVCLGKTNSVSHCSLNGSLPQVERRWGSMGA